MLKLSSMRKTSAWFLTCCVMAKPDCTVHSTAPCASQSSMFFVFIRKFNQEEKVKQMVSQFPMVNNVNDVKPPAQKERQTFLFVQRLLITFFRLRSYLTQLFMPLKYCYVNPLVEQDII